MKKKKKKKKQKNLFSTNKIYRKINETMKMKSFVRIEGLHDALNQLPWQRHLRYRKRGPDR